MLVSPIPVKEIKLQYVRIVDLRFVIEQGNALEQNLHHSGFR